MRGADAFIIATRDTVMRAPSRDLMNEVFPGVPLAAGLEEHGTPLSIDKAPGPRLRGAVHLARAVLSRLPA